MAIHKLIITEKKTTIDYDLLYRKIDGKCSHIVGSTQQDKESLIDTIYGLIKDAFSNGKHEDPAYDNWSQELINILNKSRTEQTLYDFKIGFVPFYVGSNFSWITIF